MTTLVPPVPVATRPVPWRRTAWVAWRRYRPVLLGLAGVLAALSAYLVVVGLRMRSAYDDLGSCTPPISTPDCQYAWMSFIDRYADPGIIGPVLLLLPGLVGVFVGAPLLGRELETGVFRYSWTQGIGRMRWAVALVVPAAVGVVVVMVSFGLLLSWRNGPILDSGAHHRLDPSVFPTAGLAVGGWALLAFSGSLLAGLLWRRVVPAIVSSFALWFGLAYVASALRLRWPAPLTTSGELGAHDVDLDEWWTKGGVRVGDGEINDKLQALGVRMEDGGFHAQAGTSSSSTDPVAYLQEHGYRLVHSYQPDSRYWTFQWIEVGWLVVASLALLGVTLWLLRRRSV